MSVSGALSEWTHHRLEYCLVLKQTVLLHVVGILEDLNVGLTLYKYCDSLVYLLTYR